MQDHAQPLGALGVGGTLEPGAGGLDPLLRAADALRHRRLGHEERVRDLGRGEPADGAERERELRGRRQRRVAAQQQERQRVVLLRRRLVAGRGRGGRVLRRERRGRVLAAPAGRVAAHRVRQATGRDRDQPAARALGNALGTPLDRGGQQGLLDGVLAGVESPVAADEHAEHLRREAAQQVLDAGPGGHISCPASCMTARTSIAQRRDAGSLAAISAARSMLSQSTT